MSEELALDEQEIAATPATDETSETAPDAPREASGKPPAKTPSRAATLRREAIGILWLVLAVLGFHSFIAKPFYIPSESMLPGLLVGDQLIVTKYPYGWSFISPTIPNPVAMWKDLVQHQPQESWGVQLPFVKGRLFGRLPERGDVVIVTPPGRNQDYIKRVIGLPGDKLEVRDGIVILNNVAVKRGPIHYADIADYGGVALSGEGAGRATCDYTYADPQVRDARIKGADGKTACRLPLVRETLPNGRSYETVALPSYNGAADYAPVTIPPDHVFLMGDNRSESADSRVPLEMGGLGGPVPWENIGGRAEFVTFSKNGSATWNPLTWWGGLRGGRAGSSLHPTRAP